MDDVKPTARLSRPGTEKRRMQDAVLAAYLLHDDDELPTSGRFLYYEMTQAGTVEPRDLRVRVRTVGQDVSDALTVLRRAGLIPWEDIRDDTRIVSSWRTAASVAEFVEDSVDLARLSAWQGDPPLIITESRSLAGVLRDTVAGPYVVPITAVNGQSGAGHLHIAVAPILAQLATPTVLYLGDHNPSGSSIEANVRRTLEAIIGADIAWGRVAMTAEQTVGRPPKEKVDRRSGRAYDSWECESLGQRTVQTITQDALDALRAARGLPPMETVWKDEAAQRVRVRAALRDALNGGQ